VKPNPPSRDLRIAKKLDLLVRVATKAGRGLKWIDQGEPAPLIESCDAVSSFDAYEVGIFVDGILYWSTRAPDVYNNTLIQLARRRSREASST
jgi:hypothetical protein